MKKRIISLSFGLFLAVPVLVWAQSPAIEQLRAQIQVLQAQLKSLQAQQAVPPAVPTSVSLRPPVFDDDTSDDDVIQLNNLRIQGIARNGASVIEASYDFGVKCLKFKSLESAQGIMAPCPAAPSVVYQIRVGEDTRLLLRNRQKATLKDFDIGDRINVFGFMDRDTRNVDALIIRNLDKPAVQRFIQLNSVEVVSVPPLPEAPASFYVAQKYGSPCFDYGAGGGAAAETIPCPLGIESSASAPSGSAAPSQTPNLFPPYRKYLIEVTRDTVILGRDRTPLALGDITVMDLLNIYGVEKREVGIVKAVKAFTIRDLSKPAKVGTGILRVTVSDAETHCLQPYQAPVAGNTMPLLPCGIIYNAEVRLYDQNNNLIGVRTTSDGVAVFENLREGTYGAAVSAPGYQSYEDKAVVKPGGIAFLTFSLAKVPQKITVYTKDDLRGAVGKYFSAAFLADGGSPSYDWSVTAGSLPPGLQLVNPPLPALAPCSPEVPKDQCRYPEYKQTTVWLQGTPTQAGTFKFTLTARDRLGNSGSATFISVISPAVTANLSFSVTTDKSTYTQDEQIQITIKATNNSSETKTLNFTSGCQVYYTVAFFNSSNVTACTQAFTYVSIPPFGYQIWTIIHLPKLYKIPEGTYKLTGYVIGYGEAATEITVRKTDLGRLYIEPANPSVEVGKTVKLQAMYVPPMPYCPPGAYCALPGPFPVYASWSSSDPKIAALSPQTDSVIVTGISAGKAVISASYIAADGTVYKGTANVTVAEATVSSITVTSPNGGESWTIGSTQTIGWTSSNSPSGAWTALFLEPTGELIAQGLAVSGKYSWTIPDHECLGDACSSPRSTGGNFKVSARLYTGDPLCGNCAVEGKRTLIASDSSNAPFSIAAAAPAVVTVSRNSISPDGARITGGVKGAQLFRFNVAAPADRSITLISAALEFKGDGLRYLSNIQVVDGATDAVPYSLSGLSNVTSMGADQVMAGLGQLTVLAQGVKDIFVRADVSPFTSCSTCSLSVWVRLTGLAVDTSTNQFSIIGLPVEGHSVYLIPSSFSSASPATGLASALEAIQAQLNSIAEKIRKLQR